MTSAHKLIAIIFVWIVSGGVLTVVFSSTAVFGMEGTPLTVIAVLVLAAAVAATFFITRSTEGGKMNF